MNYRCSAKYILNQNITIRVKSDRTKEKRGCINPKYIRLKIYVKGPYCQINECIREHDEYIEGRKIPIDFQSHNFNVVNI